MKNVKKHRNIKLVARGKRRSYLVWHPNFSQKLCWLWECKTNSKTHKQPVYLGLSIPEFSYSYVKQNIMKKQNDVTWINRVPLLT